MFDPVISSLPAFAGYFATAVGLLAVFLVLYVFVTPYSELALIREGNVAAAISLAGAIVGYALPIAVSVAYPQSRSQTRSADRAAAPQTRASSRPLPGSTCRPSCWPESDTDPASLARPPLCAAADQPEHPARQGCLRHLPRVAFPRHRHPQRRLHRLTIQGENSWL